MAWSWSISFSATLNWIECWWSRSNVVKRDVPLTSVKIVHQVLCDASWITEYEASYILLFDSFAASVFLQSTTQPIRNVNKKNPRLSLVKPLIFKEQCITIQIVKFTFVKKYTNVFFTKMKRNKISKMPEKGLKEFLSWLTMNLNYAFNNFFKDIENGSYTYNKQDHPFLKKYKDSLS